MMERVVFSTNGAGTWDIQSKQTKRKKKTLIFREMQRPITMRYHFILRCVTGCLLLAPDPVTHWRRAGPLSKGHQQSPEPWPSPGCGQQ